MTKTKDEIVAEIGNGEHVINYSTPIMPSDVRRAYSLGVELGASRMYDHRQKEIDEARSQAQMQMARDIIDLIMADDEPIPTIHEIAGYCDVLLSCNAAAARVMEVKG